MVFLFLLTLWQGLYFAIECEGLSKLNLDFSAWDKVLKESVKTNQTDPSTSIGISIFNYSNLVDNIDFELFKCQVENADSDNFTEDQFLAFWINVYNFMAVSIVYDHKCNYDLFGTCSALTSIRQIGQQQPGILPTQTWDLPYLKITHPKTNVSKTYSLNDVEHGYLRCPPNGWSEDVRIHAAIVCASISCPNLQPAAFLDTHINDNLTHAVEDFFSAANKGKGVDLINGKLWVSQIFDFFPEDFDNTSVIYNKTCNGVHKKTNSYNVTWYINRYTTLRPDIHNFTRINYNLSYSQMELFVYDWKLNGNLKDVCSYKRPCFAWWNGVLLLIGLIVLLILIAFFVRLRKSSRSSKYQKINET